MSWLLLSLSHYIVSSHRALRWHARFLRHSHERSHAVGNIIDFSQPRTASWAQARAEELGDSASHQCIMQDVYVWLWQDAPSFDKSGDQILHPTLRLYK